MPRRSLFSPIERQNFQALPVDSMELIQHYTLTEADLSLIRQHRGRANRLGFAVLLSYLRYPGWPLAPDAQPPASLLTFLSQQLQVDADCWPDYGEREETRREHLLEARAYLGLHPFGLKHYRQCLAALSELALQNDQSHPLAHELIHQLRQQSVALPPFPVIERLCAEAVTRANRRIYRTLTEPLSKTHQQRLKALLQPNETSGKSTVLTWLRQPPGVPNPKNLLIHLERLKTIEALALPEDLEQRIHPNRLLKLARVGAQMTSQNIGKLEPMRRYATILAILLETRATLLDETVELHERILGKIFNQAKRKHNEEFQQSGKAINQKLRLFGQIGQALVAAKESGTDPYSAIESILPWPEFTQSIVETQGLTRPEDFDFLYRLGDHYHQVRRYVPALLETLPLKATPAAQEVQAAIETLKTMNAQGARKVPVGAPTGFIRKRWQSLVFNSASIDRRFYELCALTELKNTLRSGDMAIQGSRQFKNFESYLLPSSQSHSAPNLPNDSQLYLQDRLERLTLHLETTNQLALVDGLPDASLTDNGLKISPLVTTVPPEADTLIRKAYSLLPSVKITELLLEVDGWIGFTRHFTHLKTDQPTPQKTLLLTAILADAINLGLVKMAEACSETSHPKLAWLQAWHIRDETYSKALAELVNAQAQQPFAAWWGDGSTSSSDGQHFQTTGHSQNTGRVNLKYGHTPGKTVYTHISDQYAPFHTQVINATVRDATYVLDGLLYHESDLRIEEHYTDTAGFTDHVFALMPLLGFRFAPRIRDLADKRLYIPPGTHYPALTTIIGDTLNLKMIHTHWPDILRLVASIRQGTATASLLLRKLGSYPRQNSIAVALRELGRIERSLFTLQWLQDLQLRQRVQAGLNKGEARNALARAVFFNRLGELRDRTFENQRYRASGLNLVTAAITLWNTVYLEQAIQTLKAAGHPIDHTLLPHLSPLGWEHINLTGNYSWQPRKTGTQTSGTSL